MLAEADDAARLLSRYEPLLGAAVARWRGAADPEDLWQAAREGFLRAVKAHDPSRGALATIASRYVTGALSQEAAIQADVPERSLSRHRAAVRRESRGSPAVARRLIPTTRPPKDVPCRGMPVDAQATDRAYVAALLDSLDARSRLVLRASYGLGMAERSDADIAIALGVSAVRVRGLRATALAALRVTK